MRGRHNNVLRRSAGKRTVMGIALALALAACGGETAAPEAPAPAPSPSPAPAEPTAEEAWESVVAAAEAEPTLIWMESTPTERMESVIAAFNEAYPNIAVEHVRNTGGASVAAQIVQESAAGARTADVASGVGDQMFELYTRDLLETGFTPEFFRVDDPRNVPEDFLTITAHTTYVVAYNTDALAGDEIPRTYEALVDPSLSGRVASRFVSTPFANLVPEVGEERATKLVEDFASNNPLLYTSGFTIATQLAAGEFDAAITVYHTTVPTIESGAPVDVVVLDPTPTAAIYSVMVKDTPAPNAARVFMSWLMTEEGALAYEVSTNRGNIFVASTKTAEFYSDVTLAEWPPSQTEIYADWSTRFNEILADGGAEGPGN